MVAEPAQAMRDANYWIDTVEKLKDPETACWAAHMLSVGLGRGMDSRNTSLGAALACVPREQLILGTLMAYEDRCARPYCDQILWYFEPQEIVAVYRALAHPGKDLRRGLKHFLEQVQSPLAAEI